MSINKIYINGKFLTQRSTGVQAYAFGMIEALKQKNIPFEILVPKSTLLSDKFTLKKTGLFSNNTLWEQISLAFYINKQKDALLLNFCNSAPLFCKRQIVTIHDLAFEQRGVKWFSLWFRLWYRFLIPKLSQSAKYIFTVSGFSKQEIIDRYRITADKIKIIPNGLNPNIKIGERVIKEDYLLVLGGDNPRKNTDFIINNIKEIETLGLKLVIVNTNDTVFHNAVKATHPSVIYTNYVSEPDYYSLIKYTRALVYPSLYEGFGIPVLESLCLKTPVVCSNLPVFKQAFGDLPVYFNNGDAADYRRALDKIKDIVISDNDVEKLRQKYSFAESVSLILDTLKEL